MSRAAKREERIRAVVEAIARCRAAHGYPPSVRDVKERTGFRSTSVVWYWLRECEKEGLLVRERFAQRAVALTAAGRARASVASGREPANAAESAVDERAA